ncbi:hypothetical protein BDV23DRAFT_156320 [Aspergillus alliaceus]|uniref:Uncharacterized protein n=1 Tax=Petromyces alliaceus TaxID=209559 RepID=A0A5N7C7S5_PETAA|nr:hypothetical protein BDV23DRAFT_156320 [Aspergillus alliaceus]
MSLTWLPLGDNTQHPIRHHHWLTDKWAMAVMLVTSTCCHVSLSTMAMDAFCSVVRMRK